MVILGMRYEVAFLVLFILSFSVTDILFSIQESRSVSYSPELTSCRIDDDCTFCQNDLTIVYGRCVSGTCSHAAPQGCPSAAPGWSAYCNATSSVAYCFSVHLP
jgi:hypothetical protein